MAQRIQLKVPHYLKLGGQWMIVDTGSILDVPDTYTVGNHATQIAETAGTLTDAKHATAVRQVRTR